MKKLYDVHFKITLNDFIGSIEAEDETEAKNTASEILEKNLRYYINLILEKDCNDDDLEHFSKVKLTDAIETEKL